jgi:hypothetical protein
MFKFGVIDPAKVVRTALEDAASVAGLLITTEAMVADKPKKARRRRRHARHGRHGRHDVSCGFITGSGKGRLRAPFSVALGTSRTSRARSRGLSDGRYPPRSASAGRSPAAGEFMFTSEARG